MRIGSFVIYKEKAGVISKDPIWVCFQSCWMYEGASLLGLLWNIVSQRRQDRNLIG